MERIVSEALAALTAAMSNATSILNFIRVDCVWNYASFALVRFVILLNFYFNKNYRHELSDCFIYLQGQ